MILYNCSVPFIGMLLCIVSSSLSKLLKRHIVKLILPPFCVIKLFVFQVGNKCFQSIIDRQLSFLPCCSWSSLICSYPHQPDMNSLWSVCLFVVKLYIGGTRTETLTARQFLFTLHCKSTKPEQLITLVHRTEKIIADQGFEVQEMQKRDIKRNQLSEGHSEIYARRSW